MPSAGNLSWIAIGTTVVINAGMLWRQNQLSKQYRNWNLYITEKHKIYSVLWEKLYTTCSLAVVLIQGPSEKEAAQKWRAHVLRARPARWSWGDQEAKGLQWYKGELMREFETKARDVRQYFLASQLYMSEPAQASVDVITEQFMSILQQQKGTAQPTWSESKLTTKLNEIKEQLRSELSQPSFFEKILKRSSPSP